MNDRLAIVFIVLTVVIDAIGIGLIMPVMPALLGEIGGGGVADAAIWGGILSAGFAVMQFLFAPLIGALSDRFGRRPVLLISLVVMALDYFLHALAHTIWLLLIVRLIGGITAATHSTANAYMADISDPHQKAARFGLIAAGFGVGFVLGPVLGGVLAEYGTRAPFWAAGALALANATLGFFVLRETVTDKIRRPFEVSRANPFGALRAVTRLTGLTRLISVYFFFQIGTMVYPAIWAYFLTERFNWSEAMIGLSLGLYGFFYALVMGLMVKPSIARFGLYGAVIFGLAFEIITLLILTFINNGTLLLVMIPIAALGALALPALQSAMSQTVRDDAQGELQGVLTSVTSLAMIIAPVAMTQVFALFTREDTWLYLPGAPFLLSAGLMVICLWLFTRSSVPSEAQ
ncbi:TCR/Tet family MFS transporter [Alisedimentitalea sp. MJ-SS2]|uniref:TCR/Tet family MFS transporter n=1 Tax=Aliisedimentitalea sp. MJ-SS2 TaxID=3049795 RepID=UPI002906DC0B|nr:TCR/Tet family MFS transporter [Alisedimentitalea sp. MJ-SS2]MDU8925967.1 TCR/Tet family MFS transporter [Alisedimentitalea sp. MJ-SS2]